MKFAAFIVLPVALACFVGGARGSGPFSQPGYVDNHLVGFRTHVNDVRAGKCYDRYLYRLTAAELAALPLDQRRVVRITWKQRHWRAHAAASLCTPWYVTKQIWAGGILGRESLGDPWPNCPDPYDGGGYTWTDTVACENGGQWTDSPGFYRCGLQFHPDWENRFGRLCP